MILEFSERKDSAKCKCNKCGKDISSVGFFGIKDYRMPYGSKYDYDTLTMILCVDCLDELVDGCKINPITEYSAANE